MALHLKGLPRQYTHQIDDGTEEQEEGRISAACRIEPRNFDSDRRPAASTTRMLSTFSYLVIPGSRIHSPRHRCGVNSTGR